MTTAERPVVRAAMSRHVGVRRDEGSLVAASQTLAGVATRAVADPSVADRSSWETTNLATVAAAVVAAARVREESRGCHRRTDFPASSDEWLVHLDVALGGPDAADIIVSHPN